MPRERRPCCISTVNRALPLPPRPMIFDPQRLRIADNEYHGMGFTGGITDVTIWPRALSAEAIANHAQGNISTDIGQPVFRLPLRFANSEEARKANGKEGFNAFNVNWRHASEDHPMARVGDWVSPFQQRQLGAFEYRLQPVPRIGFPIRQQRTIFARREIEAIMERRVECAPHRNGDEENSEITLSMSATADPSTSN